MATEADIKREKQATAQARERHNLEKDVVKLKKDAANAEGAALDVILKKIDDKRKKLKVIAKEQSARESEEMSYAMKAQALDAMRLDLGKKFLSVTKDGNEKIVRRTQEYYKQGFAAHKFLETNMLIGERVERMNESTQFGASLLESSDATIKKIGMDYAGFVDSQDKSLTISQDLMKNYDKLGGSTFQDLTNSAEEQLDVVEKQGIYLKNELIPGIEEEILLRISAGESAEDLVKTLAELKKVQRGNLADAKLNVAQAKEQKIIHEQTAAAAELITGPFKKLQGILESTPMGKFASEIVGVDQLMGDFTKKAQTQISNALDPQNPMNFGLAFHNIKKSGQKAVKGLQEGFSKLGKTFGSINKAMGGMLGPALAIVAVLMIAKKVAEMFFGGMMDTRKELGVTVAEAGKLQSSINTTAMEFSLLGVSAEDVAGISDSIRDNMGGLSSATSENISAMTQLTALYGISGENTGILAAQMMAVGASSVDAATSQMESVALLARASGVAPAAVMNDVAQSADAFAGFAKEGGENVFKAAIAARKLGLDMAAVENIADSLLDFESSINAQMEASMLTGRNINTDKARELALAGDLEGMQKEVTKQIGSAADFEKLNVVQRKSLAAAFGVSVSELGKMVANQDKLNNMTEAEKGHRDKMAKVMEFLGKAWAGFLSIGKALLPVVIGIGVAVAVAFYPVTLAVVAVTAIGMAFNYLNKQVPMLGTILGTILGLMTAIWIKSKLTGEEMSGGIMKGAKGMASKLKDKVTGGGDKGGGLMDKFKSGGGDKKGGPLGGMFQKFDAKKALAGAAALLIISAALFVTAKALQEFGKVGWGAMAKAGVALLGLVLVLAAIGAIMMSGVGALAIIAGAAAMLIMAAALLVLGIAIQAIGKGFDMLAQGLGSFVPVIMTLAPVAKSIFILAGAFTALGISMGALALGALMLLPALPVLMTLAAIGMLGGALLGGGGEGASAGGAAESNPVELKLDSTNSKLDELIDLMGQQGPIALGVSQTKVNTGRMADSII
jgi:hypothetical protein